MDLVFDLFGCGIGERFLVVFEMHSFQLESKPRDVQKNLKLMIFSLFSYSDVVTSQQIKRQSNHYVTYFYLAKK